MYKIVDNIGTTYSPYIYTQEAEFEKMIISNIDSILGKDGIYFDIKKLIGKPKKGATIPDGYYLDLTFHSDPRLYLVEVELNSHDVYGHIGEQILRFGISTETDKYRIKNLILSAINDDVEKSNQLNKYFAYSKYKNVNELLDGVVFDNKLRAIIIIDEATEELNNVMRQLTMETRVIEVQTYISNNQKLHRFTPFNDELLTDIVSGEDIDELDTIVVPAREEGFNDEFLLKNRWFAIRISESMIDRIKYIAAYQVAPISGITYIAEVDYIKNYKDTNKYIVYFKEGSLKKLNKIGLGKKKGQAPQAPRYTSFATIVSAKTLDDLWN